jgi:hypothetical protein
MASITIRGRWTAKDEALLLELTERKARLMLENREPVAKLVTELPSRGLAHDTVTDWAISNADALRDALEPFDSGVRQA